MNFIAKANSTVRRFVFRNVGKVCLDSRNHKAIYFHQNLMCLWFFLALVRVSLFTFLCRFRSSLSIFCFAANHILSTANVLIFFVCVCEYLQRNFKSVHNNNRKTTSLDYLKCMSKCVVVCLNRERVFYMHEFQLRYCSQIDE